MQFKRCEWPEPRDAGTWKKSLMGHNWSPPSIGAHTTPCLNLLLSRCNYRAWGGVLMRSRCAKSPHCKLFSTTSSQVQIPRSMTAVNQQVLKDHEILWTTQSANALCMYTQGTSKTTWILQRKPYYPPPLYFALSLAPSLFKVAAHHHQHSPNSQSYPVFPACSQSPDGKSSI